LNPSSDTTDVSGDQRGAEPTSSLYKGETARRVARACSDGRRGLQEIADELGRTTGSLTSVIASMVSSGALRTDADPDRTGSPPALPRGALYWIDERQLDEVDRATAAARDPGLLRSDAQLLIVDGLAAENLAATLGPRRLTGAVDWGARVVGDDGQFVICVDPEAGALVGDQIAQAVRAAGGRVRQLAVREVFGPQALRLFLRSLATAEAEPGRQP
jgi:hypothetical protein